MAEALKSGVPAGHCPSLAWPPVICFFASSVERQLAEDNLWYPGWCGSQEEGRPGFYTIDLPLDLGHVSPRSSVVFFLPSKGPHK